MLQKKMKLEITAQQHARGLDRQRIELGQQRSEQQAPQVAAVMAANQAVMAKMLEVAQKGWCNYLSFAVAEMCACTRAAHTLRL